MTVFVVLTIFHMVEIRQTTMFTKWFDSLKDRKARARVQVRIDRMEMGNFGDSVPVGGGVSELRVFYGPGYRVYYVQKRNVPSFYFRVGIKVPSQLTSQKIEKLPGNWRYKHDY